MTENDAFRVNLVKNSVGIVLVAGSKDDDLPLFCHSFKERQSVGSDRKVDLDWMSSNLNV